MEKGSKLEERVEGEERITGEDLRGKENQIKGMKIKTLQRRDGKGNEK